jgi:hypothetical protein
MQLNELRTGQRVKIVKGKYAGRVATYKEPGGLLGISARVAIQGDSRPFRTLRLASIDHANPPVTSPQTTHSNVSPTANGNQPDLESVIQKIAEIEELLTSLKLDLQRISSTSMSQ